MWRRLRIAFGLPFKIPLLSSVTIPQGKSHLILFPIICSKTLSLTTLSHELLFEIDVSNPVNKMLSTCDDIIRQHKSACLRITSLLACKDLLWIGTSAGVLLNLPVSNSTKGLQHIVSSLQGISYGHTGHVRFLTSVELNCPSSVSSSSSSSAANKVGSTPPVNNKPTTLVISGGDGYEDFRSSPASSANEVAGREDSTNHLLLWQI